MDQELALALRQRAVSALETSTTMLQVAQTLLRQGNQKEAARLRNEARYKRNESILLMEQANSAEHGQSKILLFSAGKARAEAGEKSSVLEDKKNLRARTG